MARAFLTFLEGLKGEQEIVFDSRKDIIRS